MNTFILRTLKFLLAVFVVAVALAILYAVREPEFETYIIDERTGVFNGVGLVIFNQSDGLPMEFGTDDHARIYRIPKEGVLKTQFPANNGWRLFDDMTYQRFWVQYQDSMYDNSWHFPKVHRLNIEGTEVAYFTVGDTTIDIEGLVKNQLTY
ncbi:MAG: hypothetical protein GC178_14185 [Flavobacteriales bacterium]|nr:hypothetical protein [Flavobacteriales bacterium]